jgi:hypothetical protein
LGVLEAGVRSLMGSISPCKQGLMLRVRCLSLADRSPVFLIDRFIRKPDKD